MTACEIELMYGDSDFRSGRHVTCYWADVTYPMPGDGGQLKGYHFDSDSRLTRTEVPSGGGQRLFGRWELNYAYVDGAGEDVRKAFGTATTHLVSLSMKL